MKTLLAKMNLARWIILLSVLGSIGLGWFGFTLHQRRVELTKSLETKVPLLAVEIQRLSAEYSQLKREHSREGLLAQANAESYIRAIGARGEVMIGQLNITTPQATRPAKGVKDEKYVITPQDRNRGFERLVVANFCYLLEKESKRVKVTRIHLDPEQKSLKPHEVSTDRWRWEIDVTSRQKDEQQPAAQ
jgi:hypothetical protein